MLKRCETRFGMSFFIMQEILHVMSIWSAKRLSDF